MKKVILLTCVLVLQTLYSFAQVEKNLDTYLQKIHLTQAIPGFSVVVVKGDKVIFSKGYGKQRVEGQKDFTPVTMSAIGSLTKSITALAILQLVEQKLLDLDKPVVHYLPDFKTANEEMSNKITVRMLLSNTSGLNTDPMPSYGFSRRALENVSKNLRSTFLTREPGYSYEYSNIGFSVAGLLIEKVSGKSYKDYVIENIFRPLKMKNSQIGPYYDFSETSFSSGHYSGLQPIATRNTTFVQSGEYIPAGSMTVSTATDLGNYLIFLLNSGAFRGDEIISEKNFSQLWKPNISFQGLSEDEGRNNEKYQYALGWMLSNIDGRKVVHHGGSTGTASSFTMLDKEANIATSLLFNIDLTFVDKHQFLRPYTIANNVLHIANGHEITDFGIPKVDDNTTNEFDLDKKEKEVYLGKYYYDKGGQSWMNYALLLELSANKEGKVIAKAFRENELVNEFLLDFINPSLAVTRNIASPEQIRLLFTPKGKIKEIIWGGRVYKKRIAKPKSTTRLYTINNYKIELPTLWKVDHTKNGFIATNTKDDSKIYGWFCKEKKINTIVDTYLKRVHPSKLGLKSKESVSTAVWEKQTFEIERGTLATIFKGKSDTNSILIVAEAKQFSHTQLVNDLSKTVLVNLSLPPN